MCSSLTQTIWLMKTNAYKLKQCSRLPDSSSGDRLDSEEEEDASEEDEEDISKRY